MGALANLDSNDRTRRYLNDHDDPVNWTVSNRLNALDLKWGDDTHPDLGGPAIMVFYVDEGIVLDRPAFLIGIQDPRTGFVRQPDDWVPAGKQPRWTTLAEIKRKTDEWFLNDWWGWWNDPDSLGIADLNPAESNAGDTDSLTGCAASDFLTPERLGEFDANGEFRGTLVEDLLAFYGNPPVEAVRSLSMLDDLSNIRFGRPFAPGFLTADDFAALPRRGWINSWKVRFSQRSIKREFPSGSNIMGIIRGLRDGKKPSITPIRLVEKEGHVYTLDNRRVHAFREAGVNVPYVKLDRIPKEELEKFSTRNAGEMIDVEEP